MSDTLWNLFYADVQTTCDRDEHSTRFVRWRKQRLRKDWKHFCEIMQCPRDDVNLDEPTGARELWTPPPPLNQVKSFLWWYAKNKKGLLDPDGKITVQTLVGD